ncbi:hypothetical protein Ancab_004637 [Ancistrocladus abbreviatus]
MNLLSLMKAKYVFKNLELCKEPHFVQDNISSRFPSLSTRYAMEDIATFSLVVSNGDERGALVKDRSQEGILLQGEGAFGRRKKYPQMRP